MEIGNLVLGIGLVIMGIIVVFVGHYFSKKIGILHVMIYFMASFVLLTGVLLFFAYDKPSVFY
jgi:putative Ca2+/H+ antiporter (TMEM165/GDT1 family)